MFHWQFLITYVSSVSLKFQTCYITGQWGEFTVKIMLLYTHIHIRSWHFFLFFIKYLHFYHFHFFFWRSMKFLQQNINHLSETGNIAVTVTAWMGYLRKKKHTGEGRRVAQNKEILKKMWKFQGLRKGIYRVIKKKSCYTSIGYRPWNFQGV